MIGFIVGAYVAAITDGTFRWQIPANVSELKRRLVGAFLMGFGGITALGCTIGQGVTGVSTLSVGSVIALVSIVAGGRLGLWWIVERGRASRAARHAARRFRRLRASASINRVSCTEP